MNKAVTVALMGMTLGISACAVTGGEKITRHHGEYLPIEKAVQVYPEGSQQGLGLAWNIASGYRVLTDLVEVKYAGEVLPCTWQGEFSGPMSTAYGTSATVKTIATADCQLAEKVQTDKGLQVSFVAASIDQQFVGQSTYQRWHKTPGPFYSGLVIQDITEEIKQLHPDFAYGGVLVHSVMPDSPAERSGLRSKDIVVAIEGESVRSPDQLVMQLGDPRHAQPEVTLDVYRLVQDFVKKRIVLKREPRK